MEVKINENEYEVLKPLNNKWRWFTKVKDNLLIAYDLNPNSHWTVTQNISTKEITISNGTFESIPSNDREYYSITDLIIEYENRKSLEEFFPNKKENDK